MRIVRHELKGPPTTFDVRDRYVAISTNVLAKKLDPIMCILLQRYVSGSRSIKPSEANEEDRILRTIKRLGKDPSITFDGALRRVYDQLRKDERLDRTFRYFRAGFLRYIRETSSIRRAITPSDGTQPTWRTGAGALLNSIWEQRLTARNRVALLTTAPAHALEHALQEIDLVAETSLSAHLPPIFCTLDYSHEQYASEFQAVLSFLGADADALHQLTVVTHSLEQANRAFQCGVVRVVLVNREIHQLPLSELGELIWPSEAFEATVGPIEHEDQGDALRCEVIPSLIRMKLAF